MEELASSSGGLEPARWDDRTGRVDPDWLLLQLALLLSIVSG